jgi:hypothetical protein
VEGREGPARIEDIVAAYERSATVVIGRLETLDETGWEKKVRFPAGAPAWEDRIGSSSGAFSTRSTTAGS